MTVARITHNPKVMGGKPCIRGLRVTVGTIVRLLASGESRERILQAYPDLEPADLDDALAYAAWRLHDQDRQSDRMEDWPLSVAIDSAGDSRPGWE